ncbi:MAG: TIGR03118 family protein [Acidobacteria bacterium]|nr:MAG: TIGR03118 family protein [Acidobacteriota bacterium]
MKNHFAVRVSSCCLALLLLLTTHPASAQSVAFRTTGLTADSPGAAHQSPTLLNPWGMAFFPGGDFFIAENGSGRVDSYDATGALGVGVAIPAPPGSNAAFSKPTGIAAVSEPNIGPIGTSFQFLVAADNGTIWGFTTTNGTPQVATRFVDNSGGSASYTGIAFVHPDCCGPYIAVANFGQGTVDTFTRFGDRLSLSPLTSNPFIDPDLPDGFAPFNIQLIGNQLFVTYAAPDSSHQPILGGGGLGLVNIFDTAGNFVKRFAAPFGHLDAPWGVTQASANFGPFANDILIGNAGGDGEINAFDPNRGELLGQLTDGGDSFLHFAGLRSLAFRTDGVGNLDALYDLDGAAPGQASSGVFGTITTGSSDGLVLSFSHNPLPGTPVTVTATVTAGTGVPTGTVKIFDSCCTNPNGGFTQTELGTVTLVNGVGAVTATFTSGTHIIGAVYSGDTTFVPRNGSANLIIPFVTDISLLVQSAAFVGAPVDLVANVTAGAVDSRLIPGQVAFLEGNVVLGSVPVVNGQAQLTVNSLSLGRHTIVAAYRGNQSFLNSQSVAMTIAIGNPAPEITSFTPFSAKQNSGAFSLTVNGINFVNGAVVFFNGSSRPTTVVSSTQVTAAITASDLASSGTAIVIVNNPAPGGGSSEGAMFAIDTATATSVILGNNALTVTAGQNAVVTVQATGFTGAIATTCLNAPAGVTCAFNSANNSVTIQTAATTPKGSYAITLVVSAQALARNSSTPAFLALTLGVFGLPVGSVLMEVRRRSKLKAAYWIVPMAAILLLIVGCGGYGGMGRTQPTPTPQPQSGQASASLTLTVQ